MWFFLAERWLGDEGVHLLSSCSLPQLNPNSASSAAVIIRRGKEKAKKGKKRVSAMKKIILRRAKIANEHLRLCQSVSYCHHSSLNTLHAGLSE